MLPFSFLLSCAVCRNAMQTKVGWTGRGDGWRRLNGSLRWVFLHLSECRQERLDWLNVLDCWMLAGAAPERLRTEFRAHVARVSGLGVHAGLGNVLM